MANRVACVTGASRGIGRAVAKDPEMFQAMRAVREVQAGAAG